MMHAHSPSGVGASHANDNRHAPGLAPAAEMSGAFAHPALLQVQFWSLDAALQPLSQQAQRALLDCNEASRLDTLRRPRDAQRYLAAHAGLRQRLGRWLDAPAESLRMARDRLGKPLLPDHPSLFFNLSHCDDHAMLALANAPVGVDLEPLMCVADLTPAFMALVLAAPEIARLAPLRAQDRAEALTEHWVRKEAVMKASGLGMRLAPADVVIDSCSIALTSEAEGACRQQHRWTCRLVDAPPGHRAAIALPLA